jgi:ATP-binding cassette subfamily B protein
VSPDASLGGLPAGGHPFRHALRYLPAVRGRMLRGLLCVLPSSGLDIALLFLVSAVVDRIRAAQDGLLPGAPPPGLAWWWDAAALAALLAVALVLAKGVAKYFMRYWVTGASREFEKLYRQDLFEQLLRLSPHDLAHIRTGDVMSRSVADIEAVRMLTGPAVMYVAQALIIVPTGLIVMAVIDWQLTLALLGPFLGLALVVKVAARPTQRWSHASQERLAALSTVAQENVSGIRVVKAFAREAFSGSEFRRMGTAFLEANMHVAVIRGMTSASITIIRDAGMLAIVLVGGWHLVQGRLSLGDFLLFMGMLELALWPLIAVGWMLGMYHRAAAGARRLDELFAVEPSVAEPDDAVTPGEVRGALEVRHLTFAWNGTPVLADVSLSVPAGSTLGITGRTGCGKSTLVQLMSRQVDPPPGTILLDGRDIRTLSLDFLRRSLGVVPQDTFLFSETIRSNIGFAGDHVEDETIREMARAAHVEEDIQGFPNGYDEPLGERGVTLSGGQRQRTAIARTLAADPPVIMLDDCLSAVDSVTEQAILRGLREKLAERTAVVVSHRVASLSLADHIVVLDEGHVVEQGTHAELVALGGLYADLHERQRLEAEIEAL